MYLAAITSKANSSGSEDNRGSNGVDELFESRIMFDIVRFVQRETLDVDGNALWPDIQ